MNNPPHYDRMNGKERSMEGRREGGGRQEGRFEEGGRWDEEWSQSSVQMVKTRIYRGI